MPDTTELAYVTEVGTFGDLNIEDPTAKKSKKKQEDLDVLIENAIAENSKNLTVIND
jgi:hypothetical protein